MRTEVEQRPERTPIVRRAFAGVILLVAAALAIELLIGVIKAVLFTAAIVVVVVAVLWALKTLVW